jgi:hypothetical protein
MVMQMQATHGAALPVIGQVTHGATVTIKGEIMASLYDYGLPQLNQNMMSLYSTMQQEKRNKVLENAQNIENTAAMFKLNNEMKREQMLDKDIMFGGLLEAKGTSPRVKDRTIKYLQGLGYADEIGRVKARNIPTALDAMSKDIQYQLGVSQDMYEETNEQMLALDEEINKMRKKDDPEKQQDLEAKIMQRENLKVKQYNIKGLMEKLTGSKQDTSLTEAEILSKGGPEAETYIRNKKELEGSKPAEYTDWGYGQKRNKVTGEIVNVPVAPRSGSGNGGTGGGDLSGGLTKDAVDMEGPRYLLTGKMPPMGFDKEGRKKILNRAGQIAKENGWTPQMILRMQSDYKGMDKSMSNQRKNYDMMRGFVANMDRQMERLDALYQKLPRSQYKLLNIPLVKLRTVAEGSGEEASAAALLIELGNESGKLSTNSAASIRELSESAQKQWGRIHDQSLSYNDLKKVLMTTKQLGHDRLKSTEDAMNFTLQSIESLGGNTPQEQPKERKIVSTGTYNGRKVVKYDDGSVEYAK